MAEIIAADLTIDDRQVREWFDAAEDWPVRVSLALNRTLDEVQAAIREQVKGTYTLRRPEFVLRTIYRAPGVDFAQPGRYAAAVRVHPERNVLAKFEDERVKFPKRGRALAIPLAAARGGRGGVVPRGLWPSALRNDPRTFLRNGILFRRRTRRGKVEALYVFKSQVALDRTPLRFVETATRVAAVRWPLNLDGFLASLQLGKRRSS